MGNVSSPASSAGQVVGGMLVESLEKKVWSRPYSARLFISVQEPVVDSSAQGCPTGPHWLGVQAAPLVWGLMLWGGGLRGGQGRAQGGPSGSQPAKAWDPEPHFHETTYRVGSPCSLRPSRSVVPRRRPAPLTFLVFAQTQLRPPDSELLLSSFKSLTPSTPLDM